MPRRFNCCIFNHPCPIFCPFSLNCTGNQVVNPIIQPDFAFFNNTDVGDVASQAIIPVGLVQSRGTSISSNTTTTGAVTLLAGTYEVSYFAQGTTGEGENVSIKLELNGTEVSGSAITVTDSESEEITLTQTMIIDVPQTSTLELVNNTSETILFTIASMTIRRL